MAMLSVCSHQEPVAVLAALHGAFAFADNDPCVSTVGSVEDPEKILDQAVNEMQGNLIKMRQASAQVHCAGWLSSMQCS